MLTLTLCEKYNLSLPTLLTLSGGGFRAKAALMKHPLEQSKRVRNLGLMYFSPGGVIPLGDQDGFNLTSFVLSLKKLYLPDTPFKKAIKAGREKLLMRAMSFLKEKDPKYKFPRVSIHDYAAAIFNKSLITPVFSDDRKFGEGFLVKNLGSNFCLEVGSPFFASMQIAVKDISRKLMGHNIVTLEELMIISKLGSTFRSPNDAMGLKKPSVRDRDSLRIADLGHKEHLYILEELSKRTIKEEPKDPSVIYL